MKDLFLKILKTIIIPEILDLVKKKIQESGGDPTLVPSQSVVEAHLTARAMQVLGIPTHEDKAAEGY